MTISLSALKAKRAAMTPSEYRVDDEALITFRTADAAYLTVDHHDAEATDGAYRTLLVARDRLNAALAKVTL